MLHHYLLKARLQKEGEHQRSAKEAGMGTKKTAAKKATAVTMAVVAKHPKALVQ